MLLGRVCGWDKTAAVGGTDGLQYSELQLLLLSFVIIKLKSFLQLWYSYLDLSVQADESLTKCVTRFSVTDFQVISCDSACAFFFFEKNFVTL